MARTIDNRRTALAALATAGVLWGLTVPLSKVALGWLDPAWLAVGRFAAAAPLLALLARRTLPGAMTAPVALWGAIGFGAVILLQNLGIERTSVSHAALIVGAVPALVALIALLTGRAAAGALAWAGFALALVGVVVIAGSGGSASLSGDLLVLGSAALSAVFIVVQAGLLRGRDPVAVTAVQMAAAGIAVLPIALVFGAPPAGLPTDAQLGTFLALATAGSLLPFALYAYGQARVTPEVAGAFVNLEPLVGAAVGAAVFHEAMGGTQLFGALAILGGLALSATPRRGRDPAPAAA